MNGLLRRPGNPGAATRLCAWGFRLLVFTAALAPCQGAAALKPDEQVVLYSSLAWQTAAGWQAELRGCVFEPEPRPLTTMAVRRFLGFDADRLTAEEQALLRRRLELLMVDHQRGKRIPLELAGQTATLGPSGANGHFRGTVTLPALLPSGPVPYRLAPNQGAAAADEGLVHLLPPRGLSVISDLDDTIKVSEVLKRDELLRNTLCRPFRPVPGMAAVYRLWAQDRGAAFHYVSASPWQLYLPLAEFIRAHGFPPGSFHLRHLRVKDGTALDLLRAPDDHKRDAIELLLERYPDRAFVLVGDSGERDPEIYAAAAKRFPGQIQRILIRDVTGEQVTAKRCRAAFAGLPAELWRVFQDPSEIRPPAK